MHVAAYARVSTQHQDLEVQFADIRQHVALRGWTLVSTYADVASGAKENRPEFRRLLADAARRTFAAAIPQPLRRAARSGEDLVQQPRHPPRRPERCVSSKR